MSALAALAIFNGACTKDSKVVDSATGTAGKGGQGAGGGAGAAPVDAAPDVDLRGLTGPEIGLKVAFFGDQGIRGPSRQVLSLIKEEGADFVLHLGDFDYDDDPAAWERLMNDDLGADFPWFAVVGNHDLDAWSGYEQIIKKKLDTIPGAECTGEPGIKHACRYRGLHFMLSGVGLLGDGHEDFLRQELASSGHVWRICGWHLNQQDMQLGEKGDDVGWGAFQECQKAGAMILNGHEHSYGRTKTLTNVGNAAAGHGAIGEVNLIDLAPGSTIVMVSGAGGQSLRDYKRSLHDDDTWWAAMYTSSWEYRNESGENAFNLLDPAGASFLEFGVGGDPTRVRGYYKTAIQKRVVDEFEIRVDPTKL